MTSNTDGAELRATCKHSSVTIQMRRTGELEYANVVCYSCGIQFLPADPNEFEEQERSLEDEDLKVAGRSGDTMNTDGAAQGEAVPLSPWEQDYEGLTCYGGADDETRFMTAEYANELERKAQMADGLAKALLEIRNTPHVALAGPRLRDVARAALAQFHAATEEATRE